MSPLRAIAAIALLAAAAFLGPSIWGKPWSIDHFFARELVSFALQHPMLLSYARVLEPYGLDFHSDELEDLSLEALRSQQTRARRVLAGLREYDGDPLSAEQRSSYRILEWLLEHRIEGEPFAQHEYPVNAFDGWQGFLPDFLLNVHQIHDEGDAQAYLARLAAVEGAVDQLIVRVEEAAEAGIVPPRFVIERSREGMAEFTAKPPEQNVLVTKLEKRSAELEGIDESTAARLVERAVAILSGSLLPAYARLDAALGKLQARAEDRPGASHLPQGHAYYAWALRGHTTTRLTPDQVHALGHAEVARIHAEMRRLFAARGTPVEDPVQGLQALSREPGQRYSDDARGREEILADHRAVIEEASARLPEWFTRVPRAPVAVERVPVFLEGGSAGAYYNPAPLDGSKPAIFYKNLAHLDESPRFGVRTLTFHEAVPGHHLQIALAMESAELPLFRRFVPFTAFSEGWALYAERLAGEVGLLPTPEDRLGQLQAENFRAVRLVVDTGLHAKGWSREHAIETMVSLTGMAPSDVAREVERYVVAPGQACAYKIGQLKILELRDRAREALGSAFDLRAFHALVLDGGARPLELLEEEVDAWIESRAGS